MEIAKSVSLKINIGNYQSVDLFCSIKAEAEEDQEEVVGKKLHKYCVDQITKDRNTSLKKLAELVTQEEKNRLLNQEI